MGYNCTGIGKDEKPSKENKWAVGGGGTSQSQVHATRQKLKTGTNSKVICQGFKKNIQKYSVAGNRTRVSWVKARYPNRWTTTDLCFTCSKIQCYCILYKSLFFFGGKPTISLLNIDKYWCINWWRYKLVLDDQYL